MVPNGNAGNDRTAVERGITALIVRGFKSLADDCRIDIRPLTILAGANSSGKSSALQPLLLLKQTLEATYDPGPLLLNGPNVKFTSANQFASTLSSGERSTSFSCGFIQAHELSIVVDFALDSGHGVQLAGTTYDVRGESYHWRPDMTNDDILKSFPLESGITRESLAELKCECAVVPDRCFLRADIITGDPGTTELLGLARRLVAFIWTEPLASLKREVLQVIHIPALRGNPKRSYNIAAAGAMFPGTFEEYVAGVVNHWQRLADRRLDHLGHSLQRLGLTWRIESERLDDTQVELRVGRLARSTRGGAKDTVNIADVGFGVSQVLPVVVALLTAEKDQLVYIEQPEIHLHPRAQAALAELLIDAANRGVRVVAETHSDLLLIAIQTLVANGRIEPKDVKLHWFQRREDGATEITSGNLDEAGAYGEWPEDFRTTILEAEQQYLDVAQSRHGL